MTISVIVVAFAAIFIAAPVQGFTDQTRRMRLVDSAQLGLSRMSRDIRRALPNSVRTSTSGGVEAIEILSTVDGGRYRDGPPGSPDQRLDFTTADNAFNVIGSFTQLAKPFSSTSHHLAVYNVGVAGADAYALSNVITPDGTQIDIAVDSFAGEDRVTLSPPFRFDFESPSQRVFLIDGAVSYICDPVAGTLTRYTGYSIAANQADRDTAGELLAAGAAGSLMTDRVSACAFLYAPGTAERAGMVSMELAVTDQAETVSLLAQVHVENVP
jgi:MSHA biogenesis protein MshO